MKKLLPVLLLGCIFIGFSTYADHIKFSKVIFFGDSLSDVGNNPGIITPTGSMPGSGKAPVTNMVPDGNGGYRSGDVWVVPFVKQLKDDGLLADNATSQVVPSIDFDESISVNPGDSLDFAYSGDPSSGYNAPQNIHQVHFTFNAWCKNPDPSGEPPIAQTSNALCGLHNRVLDFVSPNPITHFPFKPILDPDALYVIWIGANDLEQEFFLLPELLQQGFDLTALAGDQNQSINPFNSMSPVVKIGFSTATNALISTFKAVDDLVEHGAKYIVVINLPNLGYTEQGYNVNALYLQTHPGQPGQVNQLFTNFVKGYTDQKGRKWPGFTEALNTLLSNIKVDHPSIVIIQPDINQLFDMVRSGQMPVFTESSMSTVNKSPVMEWFSYCCDGQEEYNYDPATCKPKAGYEQYCQGAVPTLPEAKGGGSYVFFNDIHPTTCAHKYVAKFVAAMVEQKFLPGAKPFDPTENLCPEGY